MLSNSEGAQEFTVFLSQMSTKHTLQLTAVVQDTDGMARTIYISDSEAVPASANPEAPGAAVSSIRVVWTKKDEALYKEILKKHGRSMAHLCAAFPNKYAPSPGNDTCLWCSGMSI